MKKPKEEINTREEKISPALLNSEKEIKFACNYENYDFEFNCNKIHKKSKIIKNLSKIIRLKMQANKYQF